MDYDNKKYYLDMWKDMLHTFLGWSQERVMEWVEDTGMLKAVSNPEDILFNRPPQYWITGIFIPKSLKSRLVGIELANLKERIFRAFEDEHDYEFSSGTDWYPYKDKVERILEGYGEHLPVED